MGKITIAALCGMLASCGLSEDMMRPKFAAMSDYELQKAWGQTAGDPLVAVTSRQDEWIYEEMQKRGLMPRGRN